MREFMDNDFLLYSETAKRLFFDYAKDMPIYDYHCHLNPKEIYDDNKYSNLTELWLAGDHYKWRQMRICGVDESLITGNASDREKFRAFAGIMPMLIGNPLYHWAHLELQRYFDIKTPLSAETADEIYDKTEELLSGDGYSVRDIILKSNVRLVCTTDDPSDTLEYHIKLQSEDFPCRVLPTYRPEKILNILDSGFKEYIASLDADIKSVGDIVAWLYRRADFFKENGCVISDHSFLDIPYIPCRKDEADIIFKKRMSGDEITENEAEKYTTYVFLKLMYKYYELDWAVQIHMGVIRNNNTKMYRLLGTDAGFDSVCETDIAKKLSRLFDECAKEDKLPKTILYSLHPVSNYIISTMIGNFSEGIEGKIQFGSAWWFYDHYEGIIRHAKDLAALGSFGTFIGMLTDSRSFLSYPRHEYFRRIICNVIGDWIEDGQYPNDDRALKNLIEGICCKNIIKYLGL